MESDQRLASLPLPSRTGWRSRVAALADALVLLGAAVLIVVSLVPFLHPVWALASLPEHFSLQILAGALLIALMAVVRRRWRWLCLPLGVSFFQLMIIHPYWPSFGRPPEASTTAVKAVTLNVWARNTSYGEVRRYLIDSDADIVGLVEVTPTWRAELAQLSNLYPYRLECRDEETYCRQMLLSRYPIGRGKVESLENSRSFFIWAEVRFPSETVPKPVTLILTHLTRPYMGAGDGQAELALARESESLAQHLGEFLPDVILMGDFNAAPWSQVQQSLRRATQLDNQGHLVPSWPSWAPFLLRLPIDHIMARGAPRIISLESGPDVGSDHRPVEAIVDLSSPAATAP